MNPARSAAHARAAIADLSPDEQERIKKKIGAGVSRAAKRRRAKKRAIEIVREAIPDLGSEFKTVVIVLEAEDGDDGD